MTTCAAMSHSCVPWRVLMVTPTGHLEVVEVRSPSVALALGTTQDWKPYHRVATDPRGNPLISSGGPGGRA
jgi:hypothetical protein